MYYKYKIHTAEDFNNMEEYTYVVKFCNNSSKRWDGKCSEVPTKTVVKTGGRNNKGLELAEVHWPTKGKGGGERGEGVEMHYYSRRAW